MILLKRLEFRGKTIYRKDLWVEKAFSVAGEPLPTVRLLKYKITHLLLHRKELLLPLQAFENGC